MNPTNTSFDKQKLRELASAVMDGTAKETQRRELTELLRGSAAARDEYLTLADLHATLSTEITVAPPKQETRVAETLASAHDNWLPIAAVAALAAGLLIAVGWFGADDSGVRPDSFATVAQATEAAWDAGPVEVGRRLGPETLRLKSGLVRLEFDSGVEVTLEGPAVFQLVDVARTELHTGVLTAAVPPGAEGFTVDTPAAQVIDLGTSFGIDLRKDGFSDVSVFDGEVEVATRSKTQRDATNKRLLTEGESVRVGTDHEVHELSFDPKPFEKMWPFASGIVGSTESIQFVPPWPRRIRFLQSDESIFVRPEGRRVQMETDLNVNISEPGVYAELGDLTPTVIEVGKTARGYILHYSPETQLGPRLAKRVSGSLSFDRPVLGVIVRHEELLASSHRFGRRSLGEANQRRELSFTGNEAGDRVTLSEDRKTLSFDLISPGRSSDLVRVIVDSRVSVEPPRRRNEN